MGSPGNDHKRRSCTPRRGEPGLAVLGGVLVGWLVPEGPHVRRGTRFAVREALAIFGRFEFRRAALGYFGHMWELYAFWAFVPLAVAYVLQSEIGAPRVAWWSYAIIGAGCLGCADSCLGVRCDGTRPRGPPLRQSVGQATNFPPDSQVLSLGRPGTLRPGPHRPACRG